MCAMMIPLTSNGQCDTWCWPSTITSHTLVHSIIWVLEAVNGEDWWRVCATGGGSDMKVIWIISELSRVPHPCNSGGWGGWGGCCAVQLDDRAPENIMLPTIGCEEGVWENIDRWALGEDTCSEMRVNHCKYQSWASAIFPIAGLYILCVIKQL